MSQAKAQPNCIRSQAGKNNKTPEALSKKLSMAIKIRNRSNGGDQNHYQNKNNNNGRSSSSNGSRRKINYYYDYYRIEEYLKTCSTDG